MSTYEPGTVALATVNGEPGRRVVLDPNGDWFTCDGGDLVWGGGSEFAERLELSDVRPLVVLDIGSPRELAKVLRRDKYDHLADQIEAQTRPPKPEEPTGLGAVVEVAHGVYQWARAVRIGNGFAPWFYTDSSGNGGTRKWDDLNVTRVLSEGVS